MDQVDFEPAQHWKATLLRGVDHHPENKQPMSDVFKPPILLRSGGGVHNFLYQLKLSSEGSPLPKVEGSNVLGKLQITWRTNLGEPGRLQTQQILGSPIAHKDIELKAKEVPSIIKLEKPFMHLAQVEAFSSSEFELNLIAVKHGVQKITGITVFDTREKKTYDSLLELEVFVDSQ